MLYEKLKRYDICVCACGLVSTSAHEALVYLFQKDLFLDITVFSKRAWHLFKNTYQLHLLKVVVNHSLMMLI